MLSLRIMEMRDLTIVGEEEIFIKDLYYVLMKNNFGSAKECKTIIKHHQVIVNDIVVDNPLYKVNLSDIIRVHDIIIDTQPFVYYMLNKPKGYICANVDYNYPCVVDIVDKKCRCVGRLDKDTTGLLLLTNDSNIIKKLLLPGNHIEKKYYVTTLCKIETSLIKQFHDGIIIDKDIICQSSKLEIVDDYHCYVTLYEGKYHQVKKMFLSVQNQVIELKRVSFAGLFLDESLKKGEFRPLTSVEFHKLKEQLFI